MASTDTAQVLEDHLIRVLHISDLHVDSRTALDQRVVLAAFFRDIAKVVSSRTIDLIVFSGDLTFSGKAQQFRDAENGFLVPLLEKLSLHRDRLILVPGNHDCNRDAIKPLIEAGLRSTLTDRSSVNALLDDADELADARARSAEWTEFHRSFYDADAAYTDASIAHVHKLKIKGHDVCVVALDSAWRSVGKGDAEDKGHLLVGDHQVKAALELADAELLIASMHHPWEWLSAFDASDIRREAERNFDALLTGHTHVTEPSSLITGRGRCLLSAAGALYDARDWPNSYTILEFNLKKNEAELEVRAYVPNREEFDVHVEVAAGGKLTLPFGGAEHREHPAFYEVADASRARLLTMAVEGNVVAPKFYATPPSKLDDVLVEPVFLPMAARQVMASSEPRTGKYPKRVQPLEWLRSGECVVLVSEERQGLTSALIWVLGRLSDERPSVVPVLLDAKIVGTGPNFVEKGARRELYEAQAPLTPVDPLPELLVAVDNVGALGKTRLSHLISNIQTSAQPFILGCQIGDEDKLVDSLAEKKLTPKVCYLGDFGRRETKKFVAKLNVDSAEDVANELNSLLSNEKLPRSAFMVAMVSTVMIAGESQIGNATETAFLEDYFYTLLGRGEVGPDHTFGMEYKGRADLLAQLSQYMLSSEKPYLTRLELEEWLVEYFKSIDWAAPVDTVIDDLIERHVLRQDREGRIYFRHRAVRELSAAIRVNDDPAFHEWVLDQSVRLSGVIRHASGIRRNDRQILEMASKILNEAMQTVPVSDSTQLFRTMTDKHGWRSEEGFDSLVSQVTAPKKPKNDDESFDDFLDDMEGLVIHDQDRLFDDDPRELSPLGQLMETVKLSSQILRNSDLVSDPDLKRQHLRAVLQAWAAVTALIAAEDLTNKIVRAMAERQALSDGAPEEKISQSAERVLRIMPIFFAVGALGGTLSSRKLADALRSCLDDEEFFNEPGQAVLGTLLSVLIECPGWAHDLQKLLERHGERLVVLETVLFMSRVAYYGTHLTGAQEAILEETMAQAVVATMDVPRNQRAAVISRLRLEARRDRLASRMRMGKVEDTGVFRLVQPGVTALEANSG